MVAIAVFVASEVLDWMRRRRTAAVQLSLYAEVVDRCLDRDVNGRDLPFRLRELLEASRDVIRVHEAEALVWQLELCLHDFLVAAGSPDGFSRARRLELRTVLSDRAVAHRRRFGLLPASALRELGGLGVPAGVGGGGAAGPDEQV